MKKTYKVSRMDCDSCAKMIELDLEDVGVTSSCSYSKQLLEVDIQNPKDERIIFETLKKGGYSIKTV